MRNLFNELFTFRARESFSAKENFLTEGFAYFLQRNNKVCAAFVKKVLGYPVEIKLGYHVDTRSVEPTATGNCFPDLKLTFSFRRSIGVPSRIAEAGLVDQGEVDKMMLTSFAGLPDTAEEMRT